jgi:hypothetical protein
MSGRRKRRTIEEEEESNEEAETPTSANAIESNTLSAADAVKTRLRERLERSQAKAAASKKSKTEGGADDGGKNSPKGDTSPKNQGTVIPKKKKEAPSAIPKKDTDGTNKPTSSLLSMMKQAPPPPAAHTTAATDMSNKPRPAYPSGNYNTPYSRTNRPPHHPHPSNPRGFPQRPADANAPLPREIVMPGSTGDSGPVQTLNQAYSTPAASRPPPQPNKPQRNAKLEQMVWDTLHEVCQDRIKDLPVGPNVTEPSTPTFDPSSSKKRQGVDMSGSILKQKQTMHQHPVVMLQTTTDAEEDLDFFDLDDDGCIVVQPIIPMFPEDFPNDAKTKTWPLSVSWIMKC